MQILPQIKSTLLQGETVTVPAAVCTDHVPWQAFPGTFCACAEKLLNLTCRPGPGGVRLCFDPRVKAGGYICETDEEIVIRASDDSGICCGMATVLLGAEAADGGLSMEKGRLEDYPDKAMRILMVDLARHWYPMHHVLKFVDLCFLLKINCLQLHFIDDQSYTLPSRRYPNLPTPGRHYSVEKLETLKRYAAERGITLIPEFETPGHARALVAAYPEIFAVADGPDNLICAGRAEAYAAIENLLGEMAELFPESPYLHIGGDEAQISGWENCPECRDYMARNGLANVKELYSAFVGTVAQTVLDLGRTPIVWEGFPPQGAHRIPKETVVIAWESYYNLAPELLQQGFRILNGSWKPMYIVPYPGRKFRWDWLEVLDWSVYKWQNWLETSPAAKEPIRIAPTERVLGGMLCAWECTYEQAVARIGENAVSMAERTWNAEGAADAEALEPAFLRTRDRAFRLLQDL